LKEVYSVEDLANWESASAGTAAGIKPPIRLGVLGDPIEHSLSPRMQNAALEQCGIAMRYAAFHITTPQLPDALKRLRELDFVGFNLTVPHKIAAIDFLDDIDSDAKRIGAVNTVRIENGKLRGFNTDGKGFSRAVREAFVVDLRDLGVMVLGTGGAARAIAWQCAREHCERLVITSRTFEKAKSLADELREFFAGPKVLGPVPRLQAIPWEESAFRFQLGHVDLVVNATPIGLNRTDPSPIPAHLLEPHLMIFDTVYSKDRETAFVTAAIEAGARAANGLPMLLHQGALAFEQWLERPAPLDVMRAALEL
jgi:shikimate dehydrogenase